MQSDISSTAPLNQRLTLVLLAGEQADFLRRALTFYADFPAAILVQDASEQGDIHAAAWPGVTYQHAPHLAEAGLSKRSGEAAASVSTPYVVFADVSSFLLPDALHQALTFLEANPTYGACQGYSLTYQPHVERVDYLRLDHEAHADFDSEDTVQRTARFLEKSVPLFNALTRTSLMQLWFAAVPQDTSDVWQEVGLACYLLNVARLQILPIGYGLHLEKEGRQLRHNQSMEAAVLHSDPKARSERERFAAMVASVLGSEAQPILNALQAMAESLKKQPYQGGGELLSSKWSVAFERPEVSFEPRQFVEMPFYNRAFFDALAHIEFLIHVLPAGTVQLNELEAVLLKQVELTGPQSQADAKTLLSSLWQAYGVYAFNAGIVQRLGQVLLQTQGEKEEADRIVAWGQRLGAVSQRDNASLLAEMPSGRLLSWVASRKPKPAELKALNARLSHQDCDSHIGILLLDLQADVFKLQATFDSLVSSDYRTFKVIVFTTGELPAATTVQNTVHFVKVTESNYVDKINQLIKQSPSDWLMLAEAGEQFTPSGLLLASAELAGANECRAVAVDEIQRRADGRLEHMLRPGFNLDLLQSVPTLMARHWLVRRELLVEVGGYSRDLPQALEFDLLLRLIEQGGLAGMAHLSEPVLICDAPELEGNEDEKKALIRHLANRGYQAEVGSPAPGLYKIDYRHEHRPVVSILIHSQDNLPQLQRCVHSLLQRTRYQRFEVLIGDSASRTAEMSAWLDEQEKLSNRVRVFRADKPIGAMAMYNQLSQQAKGEYLIVLDAESQIVNVGWIESLLNQAQRPEVGVVGVKLVDPEGSVTQAGLILGFNGGVGSAFVGESKRSRGYMQRLVVEQNYSAVSGACMMIRKELFEAVGGMDEEVFAEGLADVDLCLKTAHAGYLTVWTPNVQVVHSGVVQASGTVRQSLIDKWSAPFKQDQAYNKNLDLNGQGFTLVEF